MASLLLYVKSSISLYSCSCKRFVASSCMTQFFHSADRWSKTWKRGNALFIVKVHVATLKQFEGNNTNNITGLILTSTVGRQPVCYTQAWSRNLIPRRSTNKSTKQSERDWNPGWLSSRPRCFPLLNHRTPNMEYVHFLRLTLNTVFISSSNKHANLNTGDREQWHGEESRNRLIVQTVRVRMGLFVVSLIFVAKFHNTGKLEWNKIHEA